jgi:hypothetical protein
MINTGRLAYRICTRQTDGHDLDSELRNQLWADAAVRAFWLAHAQAVLDDVADENAASSQHSLN